MGKRFYWVDNLKAMLIVLVVVGHLADTYISAPYFKGIYVFIYAFHMPLFVFLSGFLHKDENAARRAAVYVVLAYLLKLLDYLTLLALGQHPKFQIFTEDGAPWYMFALAAYIGITCLLRNVDLRLIFATAIILGCFSGYYSVIGDELVLSRIIVFYPYYLLGVAFGRFDYRLTRRVSKKIQESIIAKYVAAALLIAWAFVCFGETDFIYPYRRLFTGRNPFGEQFRDMGCLNRLGCYVLACALGAAIITLMPDVKVNFISTLGTKTLQIYFWHWPIVFVLGQKLGLSVICKNLSGQMLYLLLAPALAVVLALPVFGYPINKIMKYRHPKSYEDKLGELFK